MIVRDNCPACGGAARTLYRCPFDKPPISEFLLGYYGRTTNGEYRAEQCVSCGTIYQAEVGDEAFIAELYGSWITGGANDPHDAFEAAHPHLSRDGHEIMAAAAFLRIELSTMLTLDYGMGYARWARIACALGCGSYGFDIDPRRVASAREAGVLTASDDTRFDFINTEQVFEHVTDPLALATYLRGKLRRKGILKISVPSQKGILATFDRLNAGQRTVTRNEIVPLQPLEHVNCFTVEGLRRLTQLQEVRPSYRQRFAFFPGISPLHPKKALKELVRPFFQWRNPRNLYMWFRQS